MANKKGFDNYQTLFLFRLLIVGVAGFEPATSSSQTRRDNRATLHPETKGLQMKELKKNLQNNYHKILHKSSKNYIFVQN